ncbi:hypothetical protein CRG98_045219 [Punica granatum]|uniref:Uncharacterized protein n=1 Tax=Punica granatum TaxID=22663 RepID=A0A2I0HRQ5_PUNGR|nr:hypothetical protein CRG98_045219 [Punica granatum]
MRAAICSRPEASLSGRLGPLINCIKLTVAHLNSKRTHKSGTWTDAQPPQPSILTLFFFTSSSSSPTIEARLSCLEEPAEVLEEMGRADGTRVLRNLAKGRYFRSSQGFHGSTSCERPGLEEMVEIEMRLNRAWSELIKGKSKKVADSPWMKMFMSNIRLVCVPPRNRWPELASVHDVNSCRHCGDAKKSSFNGGEEEEEVKKKRVTMEEGCGVVHLSRRLPRV